MLVKKLFLPIKKFLQANFPAEHSGLCLSYYYNKTKRPYLACTSIAEG